MSGAALALLALGYAAFLLALSAVLARSARGVEDAPWPHGEAYRLRVGLARMLAVLAVLVAGVACLQLTAAAG